MNRILSYLSVCAFFYVQSSAQQYPLSRRPAKVNVPRLSDNNVGFVAPASNSFVCPDAAVLFEQTQYTGIKHWIDGNNDECRGLSGSAVLSVVHVTTPGGDPIQNRVPNVLAASSFLDFYSGYGCSGNLIRSVGGNRPTVNVQNALSVRIRCEGPIPPTPPPTPPPAPPPPFGTPITVKLYEGFSYSGISHQTGGFVGDCSGLSNVPVSSIQYFMGPAGQSPMTDFQSTLYIAVFYSGYGCTGSILGSVQANSLNSCPNGLCQPNNYPLSIRIVPTGTTIPPPGPLPLNPLYPGLILYQSSFYTGISSQTGGKVGECYGLSGSIVASLALLTCPGCTTPMSDAQSSQYNVVFYSNFACSGSIIATIQGNNPSTCSSGLCSVAPLSLRIVAA